MATDIAACHVYHWNLICLTFTISDSSCDWVFGSTSLLTRKRVWWLLSDLLLALSHQFSFWTSQWNSATPSMSLWNRPYVMQACNQCLFKNNTADSAQPRNRSIVTYHEIAQHQNYKWYDYLVYQTTTVAVPKYNYYRIYGACLT